EDVRALFDDDLLTWLGMNSKADLIAHRTGGDEQRSLFPERSGRELLQPIDGRIFEIDVVADLCASHRFPHFGCWLRHRVTAQVDVGHMFSAPTRSAGNDITATPDGSHCELESPGFD